MALLSQCTLKYGVTAIRDVFYREVSVFGFTPASLFASGEQGAWYDPSDFATMFQDSAGTTPVTAVGQSVGKINDKSGRGNHATQATAAARPVLRQDANSKYYLEFDGVDDSLSTADIDFTATNKVSTWCGVSRTIGNDNIQTLFETGSNVGNVIGTFDQFFPIDYAQNNLLFATNGNGPSYGGGTVVNSIAIGTPIVTSCVYDNSGVLVTDQTKPRINGVLKSLINTETTTNGNYGNLPLNIANRQGGSFRFYGCIYSLIIRGALSTPQEITDTEKWVADKTGVTLP